MNNNLSRFEQDGIELLIDTETGESFASVSGYARMSGKAQSTISSRLTSIDPSLVKDAEIDTGYGIKLHRLLTEDLICEWLPKDNPELDRQLRKLGVRSFLHKLAGFTVSSSVTNFDLSQEIKLVAQALDLIFENTSIKPELVSGLKLNAIQQTCPHLSARIEPARQLLINNTAQEFELLTPTEIGKRLGMSGRAVNKKLCDMGFQVKNESRKSRKESTYLPIGSGKEFSDLTLATGKKGDSTSYQQLRWYSSILSQF